MNAMKIFCGALIFLALPATGLGQQQSGQQLSIPLSDPGQAGKLILHQLAGSIRVSGYDGDEVLVSVRFGKDDQLQKDTETKDGMRRISGASTSLGAEEKGNTVRIVNKNWNQSANFDIRVPNNFSLALKTVNDGVIEVRDVNGTFEISNTNGSIYLEGVGGSLTADSVNGDIKAEFTRVDAGVPMAFSSLNGDLDIAFPASLRATVRARSDQGDIYTDFNLELRGSEPPQSTRSENGVYRVNLDDWIRGTIGGGGPEMMFKTYNGDISIRKS